MLVLTRSRKDSDIYITLTDGTVIRVVVQDVIGDRVWVGVDAPRSILVDRGEIHRKKQLAAAPRPVPDPAPPGPGPAAELGAGL